MSGTSSAPTRSGASVNLVRSLPLFAAAGVFFVAGALVFHFDPRYGPGVFTLWALLVALGFVSAIGGVASWLLTGEAPSSRPSSSGARTAATVPSARAGVPVPPNRRSREGFGRPEPPSRPRAEAPRYSPAPSDFEPVADRAPEWDEEGAQEEEPYPVGAPAEFVSVDDALRDLDGIERDLVPRARRTPPDPSSNPSP